MNDLSPNEIAYQFRNSSRVKADYPLLKLLVYSFLGGAFIAFGGLLSIVVAGGMPGLAETNPGIVKFMLGAVFPVGLIMVVVAGAELFTSDCAVLPLGALSKKTSWIDLARVWSIVYLGNFIGAVVVAWLFAFQTHIFETSPWLDFLDNLAVHKVNSDFLSVFIKGMGANWLVCLAVWMSYSAKDVFGKSIALWVPVMAFVAMGFEHSIANMFFVPTAILYGSDITWVEFFVQNLIPATLGNIIGGGFFVGFIYWFMFLKKFKNQSVNHYADHTYEMADNLRKPEYSEN